MKSDKFTEKMALDSIDKQILEMLQSDGKASLRKIARKINTSVSTVKNHLDHLLNNKIILYTAAIVDCCKIGYSEILLIHIRINNRVSINKIFTHLEKIPVINSIFQVSGTFPIFCMAKCIEKQDQLALLEMINKIEGIEEVTTQIVLQKIKEDVRVMIPES